MDTQIVQVFLGDPIEDDGERRVLSRLRADLSRRGIPARIYANFVAAGKQQRQVDLLVVTTARCVQAEVKNLGLDLPLIGQANGPWRQVLPDGQDRQLDRNYFRQASEATFAVSDVMRTLARRGDVPADGPFYRHLDTVICLHPAIPAGSKLGQFEHVDVIGYDQLVDRLAAPGPRPGWDSAHWDAFARHLGVYRDSPESPEEKARRENLTVVDDYRRRFTASLRLNLHELVPGTALVDGAAEASALNAIVSAAEAGRTVTLTGPSGGGKSHTARHAALTLAGRGRLPIWVRCSEYAQGRFSVLLARATAPYTVDQPLELIRRGWDAGAAPVLILDGLNECPAGLAGELLEQLAAASLRVPCGVVITSAGKVPLPDPGNVSHVELQLPGPAERQALLSSYGAADCPAPDAFQTPFELALAAECTTELGPDATAADLFDAYVRRRADGPVRGALRRLAAEMHAKVRGSLTVPEASLLLERTRPQPAVDTVLGCPLLAVRQGRVSFRHERFGRFLTAEKLVIDAPDPAALARRLEDPRHADLRQFAVGIERDDDRRFGLLLALADEQLLAAAEAGQFGAGISTRLRDVVAGVLTEAAAATAAAELHRPTEEDIVFGGRWRMPTPPDALEAALLTVTGRCLRRGSFLSEVTALLDATDARCEAEMRRLREEGYKQPVSAVVAATYCPGWSPSTRFDCLPGTLLLAACEQDWRGRGQPHQPPGVITKMLQSTGSPPRWGRLYLALTLLNPDDSDDAAHLPSLIQAAWKAGGYHLRLAALNTAVQVGRRIDDHARSRLVDVLTSLDVSGNIWLSTILVEALAACEAVEPMSTLDQLRADIDAVLAEPDNPVAWTVASRIFYRQYENEGIVGPYAEAIAGLDDRRMLQLCVMAARAESSAWQPGWVLREIADRAKLADDAGREVLREAATTVADSPFPVEAVQAHLEALRGWAHIADRLPGAGDRDGDVGQRAWRLVDELIFRLERDDPPSGEIARCWQELHGPCASAAVDVLSMVRQASEWGSVIHRTPQPYGRLVETYPDQIRALLRWGLQNRDQLVATMRLPARELSSYMIGELGRVGDTGTVALLHAYVTDRELGPLAVKAIRTLERRLAGNA
jgi:Nuclease-related domain